MNNLVKQVIQNGGSITPLIIPSDLTNGTGLMNPSIFIDGDMIRSIANNSRIHSILFIAIEYLFIFFIKFTWTTKSNRGFLKCVF